ncbi:MAG: DUF2057 domain-containing protein [Gammaproteobacteria bacterium]|nr:DUF2057 domain-containing protein [Gammaproteobacteria bacterium]
MKILLILLLLLLAGCSHTGPYKLYDQAQPGSSGHVTLKLPHAIDLLQLDQQKLKLPYSADAVRQYLLLPGKHQLTVRYRQLWLDGQANHEVVDSKLVTFSIDAHAGDELTLQTALPQTLSDARTFAKQIRLQLVNQQQQVIDGELLPEAKQPSSAIEVLFKDNGSSYDQLVTWWNAASDDEKNQFRRYIETHP